MSKLGDARTAKDAFFRSSQSALSQPQRKTFKGLNYFSENPALRIETRLHTYATAERVSMPHKLVILTYLIALLLAACSPSGAPATTAPTAASAATQGTTHIQVALGFVPSVQSAPFYVAQDKGYYAAEGLDVELKYGSIQNLLKQVSDGSIEFASVSGDALMPQKQQGVDVVYVMTFWTKNPIGALGIAGNNNPPLKTPADQIGRAHV